MDRIIQKDSAVADFEIFKSALISGHPGVYWNKNKAEILKCFDEAEKYLYKDLSVRDFHRVLTSVMNDISCGHSTILLSQKYISHIDTLQVYFPFDVSFIDKQLYITGKVYESGIEPGSRIISINSRSIDEILEVILSKIPADKNIIRLKKSP